MELVEGSNVSHCRPPAPLTKAENVHDARLVACAGVRKALACSTRTRGVRSTPSPNTTIEEACRVAEECKAPQRGTLLHNAPLLTMYSGAHQRRLDVDANTSDVWMWTAQRIHEALK
jgi:hypothetical protein